MSPRSDPVTGRQILVTGGAGFVGSHVVRTLHANGARVLVTDRLGRGGCADLVDLADLGIQVVQIDLRDPDAIERVMPPGLEAVVHLAAATSVLRSVERPAETFDTNVAVTARLLERARDLGVGTFVFASTNAVVGAAAPLPPLRLDEQSPVRPLTPYGASKAAAEMLLSSYQSAYAMRCPVLRFTNVYGPEMHTKDSIVPRLIKAARAGTTFHAYGDGRQVRDYVYIDDVVSAVELALRTEVTGPVVIGSGVSTSVIDLIEVVRRVTGASWPIRHVARQEGEMTNVVIDNSLARGLGWRPAVGLTEGLDRVWASDGARVAVS